ncbi:MAG TPA: cytochrome c [Polyangiaceae bacterium]|nr:cytochrome c [Polyangiaceae bacterium]
MRNLSTVTPPTILLLSISFAACYGSEEPASDPVAAGRTLAAALGCAGCHGPDLSGALGPNLTPDVATGLGAWTDGQIVAAIRTGIDDEGSTLCPSMPRFGALDDEQAAALVGFLRSLPPEGNDVAPATCGDPDVPSDAGLDDAGVVIVTDDGAAASSCAGYADPSTPASCHACKVAPCQANGCFGGYYCELAESRCVPRPSGC